MKATQANLLKYLQGVQQFIIPIYQRTYSWKTADCAQLWQDLIRVATDNKVPSHFVGSIVYIEHGIYQASAVTQLLVIDGQQRLTTISLLLHALGEAIDESDGVQISQRKIQNYYLFNNDEDGQLRYKLVLTRGDKDTYYHIIDGLPAPVKVSPRLIENYKYFRRQIAKSSFTPSDLYQGLMKLLIVDVSLHRDHDNPQLIFESLNSTGVDLTQADLVRNYILMGLNPSEQEDLYTRYWYPMESSFGHAQYNRLFDRFIRDYLTVKNDGVIPVRREVYNEFKKHVESQQEISIEDIVADIYEYSDYFTRLAFARTEDPEIARLLEEINTLQVEVAYPFLMEVLRDYDNELLSRNDLLAILNLVQSYVFRRAICGIPTNSLNNTFAQLSKEIHKDKYLESINAAFTLKDSYRRFPTDAEFNQEFVIKDVYNFRSRNYLLRKLENHNRKERVDIENYSIEHVLPQNENLLPQWQDMLGQDWKQEQERYLHTIGNLTLTGYNPELSDRPFNEKRNMVGGFADSPLRLNRYIAKQESWDANTIEERAGQLAEAAKKVWPYPYLDPAIVESYKPPADSNGKEYTLDIYQYTPTGALLEIYEALRLRILNLDSSVREEFKKLYIAYKTTTNFVDIVPQAGAFRLSLNMRFDEIDDPQGICRDVTNLGRWGNGDVEFKVDSLDQLDYSMLLIRQSFVKHSDDYTE